MPYVPLHDRPPYYANLPTPPGPSRSPHYAEPDLDPTKPFPWTNRRMSDEEDYGRYGGDDVSNVHHQNAYQSYEGYEGQGLEYQEQENGVSKEAGPSRKRARQEDSNGHDYTYDQSQVHAGPGGYGMHSGPEDVTQIAIIPSIFGIAPRNEFTKTIGEFIMNNARGRENVEIEIKLGTLFGPANPGDLPRRMRLPSMSEMILPSDYPIGNFASTMRKNHNMALNQLLNRAAASSQESPHPIKFRRARHIDSFYGQARSGSKLRVSRDKEGNLAESGCISKKRVADLNIFSPNQIFDWRLSVSTETPVEEIPDGQPSFAREKDRACYKHQFCQVDLTVVTMRSDNGQPSVSYELEVEILDVPTLLVEGEKEARGEDNRFDEILQSVLDSVRMLIRNVED